MGSGKCCPKTVLLGQLMPQRMAWDASMSPYFHAEVEECRPPDELTAAGVELVVEIRRPEEPRHVQSFVVSHRVRWVDQPLEFVNESSVTVARYRYL